MSISYTYTTLKAALVSWTEDNGTQFAANTDAIISLGETRLLRDLDLELFDVTTAGTDAMTIGTNTLTKPTGCLATRELWRIDATGKRVLLEQRTHSYLLDYWPTPATTGTPLYRAELNDTQWYIAPTPIAALNWVARYMKRPLGLSTTTATTWMGTNVGDALLYACLVESEAYLKNDKRIPLWSEKYAKEILPAARHEFRSLIRKDYA